MTSGSGAIAASWPGALSRGNAAIAVTVAPSQQPAARTAAISVNDQRVELSQEARPCRFTIASDGADAVPVGEVHRSRSGHAPFDYTFSPDGTSILIQFTEVERTWLARSDGGATEPIDWGAITDVPDWQRRR